MRLADLVWDCTNKAEEAPNEAQFKTRHLSFNVFHWENEDGRYELYIDPPSTEYPKKTRDCLKHFDDLDAIAPKR